MAQKIKEAQVTGQQMFLYKDAKERDNRTNRLVLICTIVMYVITMIYLVLRMVWHETERPFLPQIANWVVIISLIVNVIHFKREKLRKKFRLVNAITTAVIYIVVIFISDAKFINWMTAGAMIMNMPFFDKKYMRNMSLFYCATFMVSVIYRGATGQAGGNADDIATFLFIVGILFAGFMTARINSIYVHDMTGYMESQQKQQEIILKDVLAISKVVKSETDKSNESVAELYKAAETVQRSMQDISSATELTAESVQAQNVMTQEIQTAIEGTVKRSNEMVTVAEESNGNIQENIQVMEGLQLQSKEIAITNEQVTEAMQKLQQKTKEVEEITGMIYKISSQTNMLALNASIESARAGEAGRGFAVVAEQIRQLAEQTRVSTENISKIVAELDANAGEVVAAVGKSMEATEQQNEMIATAAENFEKLDRNIISLIGGIREIDTDISGIYESNNRIVESISQLSATAEEITANAEQAREASDGNLHSAAEVKDALQTIKTTSEGMDKYF